MQCQHSALTIANIVKVFHVWLKRCIFMTGTSLPASMTERNVCGNRGMPEGIDKKGSVRGLCAGSVPAQRDCVVCLTTVTGRSARKREELNAKRPGEPLFCLLTGGIPYHCRCV